MSELRLYILQNNVVNKQVVNAITLNSTELSPKSLNNLIMTCMHA